MHLPVFLGAVLAVSAAAGAVPAEAHAGVPLNYGEDAAGGTTRRHENQYLNILHKLMARHSGTDDEAGDQGSTRASGGVPDDSAVNAHEGSDNSDAEGGSQSAGEIFKNAQEGSDNSDAEGGSKRGGDIFKNAQEGSDNSDAEGGSKSAEDIFKNAQEGSDNSDAEGGSKSAGEIFKDAQEGSDNSDEKDASENADAKEDSQNAKEGRARQGGDETSLSEAEQGMPLGFGWHGFPWATTHANPMDAISQEVQQRALQLEHFQRPAVRAAAALANQGALASVVPVSSRFVGRGLHEQAPTSFATDPIGGEGAAGAEALLGSVPSQLGAHAAASDPVVGENAASSRFDPDALAHSRAALKASLEAQRPAGFGSFPLLHAGLAERMRHRTDDHAFTAHELQQQQEVESLTDRDDVKAARNAHSRWAELSPMKQQWASPRVAHQWGDLLAAGHRHPVAPANLFRGPGSGEAVLGAFAPHAQVTDAVPQLGAVAPHAQVAEAVPRRAAFAPHAQAATADATEPDLTTVLGSRTTIPEAKPNRASKALKEKTSASSKSETKPAELVQNPGALTRGENMALKANAEARKLLDTVGKQDAAPVASAGAPAGPAASASETVSKEKADAQSAPVAQSQEEVDPLKDGIIDRVLKGENVIGASDDASASPAPASVDRSKDTQLESLQRTEDGLKKQLAAAEAQKSKSSTGSGSSSKKESDSSKKESDSSKTKDSASSKAKDSASKTASDSSKTKSSGSSKKGSDSEGTVSSKKEDTVSSKKEDTKKEDTASSTKKEADADLEALKKQRDDLEERLESAKKTKNAKDDSSKAGGAAATKSDQASSKDTTGTDATKDEDASTEDAAEDASKKDDATSTGDDATAKDDDSASKDTDSTAADSSAVDSSDTSNSESKAASDADASAPSKRMRDAQGEARAGLRGEQGHFAARDLRGHSEGRS